MKIKSTLFLALFLTSFLSYSNSFKKVAYIPSYRMFYLEKINYDLITHVMAAFANPDEDGNLFFSGYNMHNFVTKVHNNNAEAIISIGGGGNYSWGSEVSIYKDLFATPDSRTEFVHKIMDYMRTYNFDGLDNDIEGNALALSNFNVFTQELGDSLHAGGYEYSAAIGVGGGWGVTYWDNASLAKLDFMMTMSYGGVGNWNYNTKEDDHTFEKMRTDMEYFTITKNISPEKVIGGIPFYAVEFPATAQSNYGDYHQTFCSLYNDPYYDNQDPFHSDTLISEEGNPVYLNSIETIQKKIDYCSEFGGGIMIWEIGQDCYGGDISIQNSMYAYINGDDLGINTFNPIEFSVYPNPSDNLLNVKVPIEFNGDYTLLNHLGQIAAKGSFTGAVTIDISELKSGIYYLELNDQKHNFKKAEIIKK
jgi:GH18 family chitinase